MKKAQNLFPEYVDAGNPYQALSELYLREGREEDALSEFLSWARYDESSPSPLVQAAEIMRKRHAWQDVVRTAERSVFAYPYSAEVHQMLGDAACETGEWSTAVLAYQARVGLDPPDMAGAYYDLARAWFGMGNRAEARRATLRSLEIAPNFEKAQELLLKLREVAK
jgi:tetratricopeptide (TPR) repeat protein